MVGYSLQDFHLHLAFVSLAASVDRIVMAQETELKLESLAVETAE